MPVNTKIANITRGSLHDGKGIRTVVYFKGCNMHCKWCHNPETIPFEPQILYASSKCIKCGICVDICGAHHSIEDDEHVYNIEDCSVCGKCAENCPLNALELCGVYYSPRELLKEILKDKHYYDTSSGGVTFSGGECLLHIEYLYEICRLCIGAGISVTIESALNVPWKNIGRILPFVETFYVDIKHMEDNEHIRYTGCSNRQILDNIIRLAKVHDSVLIRTPLIPGVNDSAGNLIATAEFAKNCGDNVKGLELLRYNILGSSKYSLVQQEFESFSDSTQSMEEMDMLCDKLNKAIDRENFVFWIQ